MWNIWKYVRQYASRTGSFLIRTVVNSVVARGAEFQRNLRTSMVTLVGNLGVVDLVTLVDGRLIPDEREALQTSCRLFRL
jgi:hypothetical protein